MKRPSVLVIRKKGRFSELLGEAGCTVVDLDLIRTKTLGDLTNLDQKIVKLDDYDGIFFTSPVAADIFAKRFSEMDGRFSGKIYVLGKRARKILESCDFEVIFGETLNTAADLLGSIESSEFTGKKFLFIRGQRSLRTIPKLLSGRAQVDEVPVYKTVENWPVGEQLSLLKQRLRSDEFDWICFFSPSGVEAFYNLFAADLTGNIKAAAIGVTTAKKAASLNFKVSAVSPSANAVKFAQYLVEYFEKNE